MTSFKNKVEVKESVDHIRQMKSDSEYILDFEEILVIKIYIEKYASQMSEFESSFKTIWSW